MTVPCSLKKATARSKPIAWTVWVIGPKWLIMSIPAFNAFDGCHPFSRNVAGHRHSKPVRFGRDRTQDVGLDAVVDLHLRESGGLVFRHHRATSSLRRIRPGGAERSGAASVHQSGENQVRPDCPALVDRIAHRRHEPEFVAQIASRGHSRGKVRRTVNIPPAQSARAFPKGRGAGFGRARRSIGCRFQSEAAR